MDNKTIINNSNETVNLVNKFEKNVNLKKKTFKCFKKNFMNILSTPLSIKRISKFYNLSAIIDRKVCVMGGKGTIFYHLHCI